MRWIQSENEEYYPDLVNSKVRGKYLTKYSSTGDFSTLRQDPDFSITILH